MNSTRYPPVASSLTTTTLLTAAEEYQLISTYHAGPDTAAGRAARERLILANMRLVYKVANKMPYTGSLSRDDLAGYGVFGLMRAIDGFDLARGNRFSTYAMWWIRQAILRALADYGRTVRLPVHRVDQLGRAHRLENERTLELGREPTAAELAAGSSGSEPTLAELRHWANLTVSLDRTFTEDESLSIADIISDDTAEAAYQQVDDRAACAAAMACLSERERRAVRLNFGLEGEPRGLGEVGRELGVTRERVRQILEEALTKMRLASYRRQADEAARLDYLAMHSKGFIVRDRTAFAAWLEAKGFVRKGEVDEWWRGEDQGVRVSRGGYVLCLGRDKARVQELLASHAHE